jgi:predicted ATPase
LTATSLNTINESQISDNASSQDEHGAFFKSSAFLKSALGQAASIFSAKHIEAWIEEFAPAQKVDPLDVIGKYSKFKIDSSDVNTSSSTIPGEADEAFKFPGDISLDPVTSKNQIFMIDLVPLLSDILPIKTVENEITASMDPEMRWRMCDALLVNMFQVAFAVHKVLIIVENLQWCDLLSLGVLAYLIRDTKGGLFFFTARPVEVHDMWRSKHKTRYLGVVGLMKQFSNVTSLPPLSHDEVRKILMAILGAEIMDASPELKKEEVLQQIMKRTGCMPFSVVALCLAIKNARLQGKHIDINRLPSGVHNIIVNRFDQLSSKEKVIMKAAAIIGEDFSVTLLAETLDQLGSSNCSVGLVATLHDLANAKLIHLKKSPVDVLMNSVIELGNPVNSMPESEMIFEFTDQSVRYGIYNLLLEAQRTTAHLVVAKLLEKQYERNPNDGELFAQLVHHYLLSDDDAKKLHYAELASKMSRKSGEYKKCINYGADLIKFATNESLDALIIKSGINPRKEKETVENESLLQRVASRLPTHAMGEANLTTVHNIFAARHNSGINTQGESLSMLPMEMWLDAASVHRMFKLTDDATQSGISRMRVSAWIAEAADAYCR